MDLLGVSTRALRGHFENLSTVLGFGLLLFFVFFFLQFSNFFASSGSVFVFYNFPDTSFFSFAMLVLSVSVFLFFYSIFACLMVFAVRNSLSRVKVQYYLAEKIRKFAFKFFIFSFALSLLSFLLVFVSNFLGIPSFVPFFVLFLVFCSLQFVLQAIVIDEASIAHSVFNNFEFVSKNFDGLLLVAFFGVVLVIAVALVEFVFDYVFFAGNIFSFLLTFFFVIPFIESLKTEIYMKKFTIIR